MLDTLISMSQPLLLVAHVLMAVGLIALVLLQQGKGADSGAAFGSGASATMFGARGSASFLSRATSVLATVFFANSLLLAHLAGRQLEPTTLFDEVQVSAPAAQAPLSDIPAAPPMDAGAPQSDVPQVAP